MFERFTEKSRRAIYFARGEVIAHRSWAICPEHILLGILRADEALFETSEIGRKGCAESIRSAVNGLLDKSDKVHQSETIPLSPFGKDVILLAAEESCRLQQNEVQTAHLLIAILLQAQEIPRGFFFWGRRMSSGTNPDETLASRILKEYGFTLDGLRNWIVKTGSIGQESQAAASLTEENKVQPVLKIDEDLLE